jgi:hypothetical protein
MPTTGTPTNTAPEITQYFQACLRAIIRAETEGRLPSRFTDTGQAVWNIFRNELTTADLIGLAIQDVGVAMPIPFDPGQWWSNWPDWAMLHQSLDAAQQWVDEALHQLQQPQIDYLQAQASFLGIELPSDERLDKLPTPLPHEHWLELPGTGGWVAYTLCSRPEADLYFWENFTILCATPQEMLLAGLIAWELGAPPRSTLPIHFDDSDLTTTLKAGHTYQAIVGQEDRHGHRDLRILHQNGEQPLWV